MFNSVELAAVTAAVLPHLISPVSTPPGIPADFFQRGGHYGNYVSLVISPSGRVVSCRISDTKGNPYGGDKVCPDVRPAIFSPGTLSDGRPLYIKMDYFFIWPDDHTFNVVNSDINLTIEHLPTGLPLHPRVGVALDVDAQGRVLDCKVAATSTMQTLDKIACESASSAGLAQIVKDEKDIPVKSIQYLTVGFGAYTSLVLKKEPSYAALGDSGPYFPERAIRLNVDGYVIMECSADASGQLSDCALDEEAPLGFAFGTTARKMAKDKWMRVRPDAAGKVLIRVDFPRPGNFRFPAAPYTFPK